MKRKSYESLVTTWLQDPLISPITGEAIQPLLTSDSEYAQMYDIAWRYFESKKIHPSRLPKHHILFKKVDVLNYRSNPVFKSISFESMYDMLDKLFIRYGDLDNVNNAFIRYPRGLHPQFSTNEKIILYLLAQSFTDIFYNFTKEFTIKKFSKRSVQKYMATIQKLQNIRQFLKFTKTRKPFKELFRAIAKKLHEYPVSFERFYKIIFADSDDIIQSFAKAYYELFKFLQASEKNITYHVPKTLYLQKLLAVPSLS